jgi:hypothetical protein
MRFPTKSRTVFGALATAAALCVASTAGAAPLTFLYQTTIDATAIGGSATEALSLEYTFDTTLVNGSGPTFPNPQVGSYGPISGTLTLGGDSVSLVTGNPFSTGITVINDGGGSSLIDSYDVRGGNASAFSGTIAGFNVTFFRFILADIDATMFSNTDLPGTLGFLPEVNFQQVRLTLDTDGNGTGDTDLLISEFESTPPENLPPLHRDHRRGLARAGTRHAGDLRAGAGRARRAAPPTLEI